jgi:hypothetical protein
VLLSTAVETAGAGAEGPVTIAAALAVGAVAGASALVLGADAASPVSPLVVSASSAGCAIAENDNNDKEEIKVIGFFIYDNFILSRFYNLISNSYDASKL